MKKLLLTIMGFFMFILFPAFLWAATIHYVTPSGAGSKTGVDWNNAYQGLPSSMIRGDIYVVAGGNYSAISLGTPLSGTSIITIRKASSLPAYGDDLVAGWNSSYETTQAIFAGQSSINTGYYTIDGVTPSTGYWQTSGYGIKFTYSSASASPNHILSATGGSASYITIKHCEFADAGSAYNTEQWCLYALSSNYELGGASTFDNWVVSHNYFHDASAFIKIGAYSPNGWIVEYNYFAKNFTGTSHGAQIILVGTGSTTPHQIRYNWFEPYAGTSSIDYLFYQNRSANDISLYGNVWHNPGTQNTGNGTLGTGDTSYSGLMYNNWKIYNNTFYGDAGSGASAGLSVSNLSGNVPPTGWEIRNNLFYNCPTWLFLGAPSGVATNNYMNQSTWAWGLACTNCRTSTESLSTLFPNAANGDYHLGAGSQAIDMGFNLSSPYNVDPDGVTRPQGAAFDAGAYEFVTSSTGGTTAIPMPPSLSLVN